VTHEGVAGDRDEGQPALGRLVADPVDDVGLFGARERGELDRADRGDVARRLQTDREGQRLGCPVARCCQLATAVRRDSGIGRETGTGRM